MGSLTRSGQTLLFDDPSGAGPLYPDISDFGIEGVLWIVEARLEFSIGLLVFAIGFKFVEI